jgi:RNA 2',3'-cyclic 3'-phosphodiesterase
VARLFVAVWPPAEVLDRLEALPRVELAGCRWTIRAQWHVTLRFLGEADPDVAAEALATLPSSSSSFDAAPSPRACEAPLAPPACEVAVAPCACEAALAPRACEVVVGPRAGLLGSGVVVLPVAGLDSLAAAVKHATLGIGRPSTHPFSGHLTLARIKGPTKSLDLDSLALSARWPVGSVSLVASHTRPTGATYTTLTDVPLR